MDAEQALRVLKKRAPRFRTVSNARIHEFAESICNSLSAPGGTLNRADRANLSSGMTSLESVTIVMYSVYTSCPEFSNDVDGWINRM